MKKLLILAAVLAVSVASKAGMYITEWMYDGTNGEFVEFTNMSTAAINMSGWSFDDDSRTVGVLNLSGFEVVAPGQSVIISEAAAETFRTAWGLSASVKIIGGYTNNLGKADEINLYDGSGNLADRLTYSDQAGYPVTKKKSGNILEENLGINNAKLADLSSVGDVYSSNKSTGGDIANPGTYYAAVPEPATMVLLGLGSLLFVRGRNKA